MAVPEVDALKRHISERTRRTLERPRRASVLVPIVDDGGPLRLILTRRTDDMPTHAGHVAFPGGFIQAGDDGPVQTALREAHEEIDLPPGHVEILGLLDDFPTITDDVAVTPVVGRIHHLPPLRPQPGEVARIFEIPIAVLLQKLSWRVQQMERAGRSFPVYFCAWDEETLWGLSAYIVLHLLDVGPFSAPFPVPEVRLS